MKVHFLGAGSATDKDGNTSMILNANGQSILLDCGFTVPAELWRHNPDPDFLDAIWVSHHHADHSFGLPAVILRMKKTKRNKPLYILTTEKVREKLSEIIDLGYPNLLKRLNFEVRFIEFEKTTEFAGLNIGIAETIHNAPSYAIRISNGEKVFCYSGDGMYSEESKELFSGCDLLVHECKELEEEKHDHANLARLLEMIEEINTNRTLIVHFDHHHDKNQAQEIMKGKKVSFAKKGDTVEF